MRVAVVVPVTGALPVVRGGSSVDLDKGYAHPTNNKLEAAD